MAAFAADPDNVPAWYEKLRSVEWRSAPPLAVGSQVAFVAQLLGRRLAYTYEIRELVPGERLVMSTAEGPFPMETTYTWSNVDAGSSRMVLRNRGEPAASHGAAPLLRVAVARANRKDIRALKRVLESASS